MPETELVKLNELTAEGNLHALVATLAKQLQSVTAKNADDTLVEVDFACDSMGSRGRLRFRSYRRPPTAAYPLSCRAASGGSCSACAKYPQ